MKIAMMRVSSQTRSKDIPNSSMTSLKALFMVIIMIYPNLKDSQMSQVIIVFVN